MPARKTPEDYHNLAADRGLVWLGETPPGSQRPTTWRCLAAQHVFERTYNLVTALKGCPLCSGRVRKTPEDYHTLARAHGLTWLGPAVNTTREETRWRCGAGHVFAARYTTLQQGSACPHCAGRASKTFSDFAALARAQGLTWLGRRARATREKTSWRCAQGHRFSASFNGVQAGHGCPVCAGNAPLTDADYRRAGRAHGLTWLGPRPKRARLPARWRCRRGHLWVAPLSTVLRGKGCPACRPPRRTTADYRALARSRGLTWVGPLPATVQDKTQWRCKHGHVFSTRYALIRRGTGCPRCSGHGARTALDYRELARARGLTWLGPEVRQTNHKTTWQCRKQHRFSAGYNTVQGGHGCPVCAGNAPKAARDYRALARSRKFKWIGPELPRAVSVKTTWECSLGHRWQQRYNTIQQGSGCPACARYDPAESARTVRRRARDRSAKAE